MKNNYLSYKSIFVLIVFNVLIILMLSLTVKGAANSLLRDGSDGDEKYNKGVTVSPSHLKFNVDLGKIATKEIKITNYTGKRQKFNLIYNDFDISNEGKSSFLEAGTSDYSLSELMSISPTFVEIDPGSAAKISVTVQLPMREEMNKASWGVILISQAEEKKVLDPGNESGNTVAFGITPTFAFGIWVYQNPPNVENMQVDITNFSFEKKADFENALFLSVKNQGDGISFCQAYVELTNLSTGKQTLLGGKNYTILPGYERIFVFDVPAEIEKGKYSAVGVLDYKSEKEIVAAELELTID